MGLEARLSEAEAQNASLRETILDLTHENELLKRRTYFRPSELQLALGDLLDSEKHSRRSSRLLPAA